MSGEKKSSTHAVEENSKDHDLEKSPQTLWEAMKHKGLLKKRKAHDKPETGGGPLCGNSSSNFIATHTEQTPWGPIEHKVIFKKGHNSPQRPSLGNQPETPTSSTPENACKAAEHPCVKKRSSNPPKPKGRGNAHTRQKTDCNNQQQKGEPPCKKQKMDIPTTSFTSLLENMARLMVHTGDQLMAAAREAPSLQSADKGASHAAFQAIMGSFTDRYLKIIRRNITRVNRGQRGGGQVRGRQPPYQTNAKRLKLKKLWQSVILKCLKNARTVKSRQKRSKSLLKFLGKVRKPENPNDDVVDGHSPHSEEEAPSTSHLARNATPPPVCAAPEEEEHSLEPPPSPEPPRVYLEREGQWERQLQHLPMDQYVEVFRFVNLEQLNHPLLVQEAIQQSIQGLLNEMSGRVQEGDLVQLHLQGGGLSDPLRSVRKPLGVFPADDFINQMANLMQSNAEIHLHGSLRLVMTVIRNRGGRARRVIGTILYSEVIQKKKQHLLNPNNDSGNLCFGISLLGVMSKKLATIPELAESARLLYRELNFCDDEQKILLSDVAKFEKHLKVNIGVVMNGGKGWEIFRSGPPAYPQTYFVLLHDEHFYGIRNVKAFFGKKSYCEVCGNAYSHAHSCKYRCRMCLDPHCVQQEKEERCPNCKVYCKSRACLERHMVLPKICKTKSYCKSCHAYAPQKHTCRVRWCKQCKEPVGNINTHYCFMSPLKKNEISNKYVFYDFECMQETGIHIPNYIYAMGLEECNTWEFKGTGCVSDFVKKFINKKFQDYTFLAHNAKGYDNYFIIRQLLVEKIEVDLITQGGKLMCVTVKKLGIRFLDSLNFLPMKLAKMPQAMGFQGCKGFFPHFFNTAANSSYIGPLPKMEDYGIANMMPGERAEFVSWYQENQNSLFDLQKELAYYCQMDVKILRKACLLYREEIISMAGIDPFKHITLAGVCMAMYRHMFLKPYSIALLPHDHYHRQTKRFSTASIQWLLYLERKEGVEIQHALKGGEFKIGPYFLDGYAIIGGQPISYEFQGCFFHGCPSCFNPTERNPLTDSTFGELYYRTQRKESYLKSRGFVVRALWEHEWREMVETDRDLGAFLSEMKFPSPLLPREALFGGRTNAICLYYKAKAGEKIHYYDFTSLYPFVNKTMKYPIGHPQIIYKDFAPLSEYFGLIKLKVHPPRGLFLPVLPSKVGDKLVFTLCRTCAEAKQKVRCEHSAEERALEGVWCSVELMKALEKGYTVMSVSEVWHFEESSEDLFSEYIKMHLRQKQEASGYPNWCTDDEKKAQYIADYLEKEGVQLRAEHIAVNPAKRQIAKLFLNSLWGKFGQRSNLVNTTIVRDATKLLEYAFSPAYDVSGFDIIDDETASVAWKHAKDSVTLTGNTNVLIACFTTAYARLQLYDVLDKLQDRCLYHDTDSVIFVSREGDWNPPLGDYLGDLTSEIPPDEHITEFTSAGPKTYGYKLSGGKACMKAKGITLNVTNSEKINFDTLKDLVLDYTAEQASKEIRVQQPSIIRDKSQWLIQTGPLKKTLKVVYDKRVLVDDYKTLPYGF